MANLAATLCCRPERSSPADRPCSCICAGELTLEGAWFDGSCRCDLLQPHGRCLLLRPARPPDAVARRSRQRPTHDDPGLLTCRMVGAMFPLIPD